MTWVKLDDGFTENRKVDRLSDRAFRLYVAGLCFCGRNLTDGVLTEKDVRVVAASVQATRKHVSELEAGELWQPNGVGHTVKDYLEYNLSAAQVKAERQKARERAARARERAPERAPERTGEAAGERAPVPSRPVPALTPSLDDSEPNGSAALAVVPALTPGQELVAFYVNESMSRGVNPPKSVKGQVAQNVGKLLKEGVPQADIAAGLGRMLDRGIVQPSLLANFVAEANLPAKSNSRPDRVAPEEMLRRAAESARREHESQSG